MHTQPLATLDPAEAVLAARQQTYTLLSSFFRAPVDDELRVALCSDESIESFEDMLGVAAVTSLREAAQLPSEEEAREALKKSEREDFNELLKVPTGRYVKPYESVYRDSREVDGRIVKGLLWGRSTLVVKDFYEKSGGLFDMCGFRDIPDHIAAELAFMAFLCEQEATARSENRIDEADNYHALQAQFVKEHLAEWAPDLCAAIIETADTALYKAIGHITSAFVRADALGVFDELDAD